MGTNKRNLKKDKKAVPANKYSLQKPKQPQVKMLTDSSDGYKELIQ